MIEREASEIQQAEPSRPGPDWGRRLFAGAVAIVVLVLAGWIAAAFLPRWWAHRLGGQVDGSMASGILVGLGYGFVFTAVPLLVLALVFRRRRSWKLYAFGVVFALLLAGPNLMTLGIVVGRGKAAHAGERTLDVDAPGVRDASLAGSLLAVAALVLVGYLVASRSRARRAAGEARRELAKRDAPRDEAGT